jgi:hypothetical protein
MKRLLLRCLDLSDSNNITGRRPAEHCFTAAAAAPEPERQHHVRRSAERRGSCRRHARLKLPELEEISIELSRDFGRRSDVGN